MFHELSHPFTQGLKIFMRRPFIPFCLGVVAACGAFVFLVLPRYGQDKFDFGRKQGEIVTKVFAEIQLGMSRSEMDALLGSPTIRQLSLEGHAWFFPPPRLELYASPASPGTIGVRFTADDSVASK